MNQFEEELQKKIEKGEVPPEEDFDAKAYQEIFRVLKKGIKILSCRDSGMPLPLSVTARKGLPDW